MPRLSPQPRPLQVLLSEAGRPQGGPADPLVTQLAYDSRKILPGGLFVAIPGTHTDGHLFLAEALRRGAVAVVVEGGRPETAAVRGAMAVVEVEDTRRALADVAAAFYGFPARRLRVTGVTGTDGKTTTCYLLSSVLETAGCRVGMITTVDFRVGERWQANSSRQTTPESLEVQEMLAKMVAEGCTDAVIESTSHGLALARLEHCEYDIGVMTNVTSDHLEFHHTREQYVAAKARLFQMLDESRDKGFPKAAVLNLDDPASALFRSRTHAAVVSYALDRPADVTAAGIVAGDTSSSFDLVTAGGSARVDLALPARFNVANALAAAGAAHSQGFEPALIARGLSALEGVPGRMERIDEGQPFAVIVDYAHTPEALRKVLTVLRPLTRGRLIALFGAAGERDPGRRSGMGLVAGELADFAVLANEDPREEDERKILEEIAAGLRSRGRRDGRDFTAIPDRREAIRFALRLAAPSDLLLLAGKGHEGSIIVGREKLPWDDRAVAREELRRLSGRGEAGADRAR